MARRTRELTEIELQLQTYIAIISDDSTYIRFDILNFRLRFLLRNLDILLNGRSFV